MNHLPGPEACGNSGVSGPIARIQNARRRERIEEAVAAAVIGTSSDRFPPRGALGKPPVPSRVSRIRTGAIGWNVPPEKGVTGLTPTDSPVPTALIAWMMNV